jgi:uncharacterized protein
MILLWNLSGVLRILSQNQVSTILCYHLEGEACMSGDDTAQPSAHSSEPTPAPTMPGLLGPVAPDQRITAIDMLRGVALLGILVVNIDAFALPGTIVGNPSGAGGFTGIHLLEWKFQYLLFYQKMMAIFSALFGAGLVLMYQRAEASARKLGGVYYRRILWLLLFGLAHAYLLWFGDILFYYAMCGLLLYLFRRWKPRNLIIVSITFLLLGIGIPAAGGAFNAQLRGAALRIEKAQAQGQEITPGEQRIVDQWHQLEAMFNPDREEINREIQEYRGSYGEILKARIPQVVTMQTQGFLFMIFWRVMGIMLLGMALLKLGVFSAKRTQRFYTLCILIGYGVGLPLAYIGMHELQAHDFDFIYWLRIGSHYNYVGSLFVAAGHLGVVMTVYKMGLLRGLTSRLAAVGRMALSNYLFHTVVFTTIFYGYGFGLFGKIDRFWLLLTVFGMWITQLVISPIWLRYFRFGPAEWLWRSLTYWRRQPMRAA